MLHLILNYPIIIILAELEWALIILACLYVQKNRVFGGPAFIQQIRTL